jgi:TPR repeat protein
MNKFLVFPVLLVILFATPAFADFQKGVEAVERGDYETAFNEWAPIAERGGAVAQNNLGLLYANGRGVTHDYVRAHMWWDIAASLKYEDAVAYRAKIEKLMTPEDLSKARELARECVAKNYQGC